MATVSTEAKVAICREKDEGGGASPLGLQALSSRASITVTSRRPMPLVFGDRAGGGEGGTHRYQEARLNNVLLTSQTSL